MPNPLPPETTPEWTAKLLPCPFCGNASVTARECSDDDDRWAVACDSKASECPMEITVYECYNEEQAVEAWNHRASVPNTGTALSEDGVWVVLDAEGLPEAVYCREDTAREYADDPNENKAGEGPFTVARFVRAASVVRLDGKPDVRDADGYISGDPMLAGPELTMLREMADLVREYFDERNRPSVSWDGMPSVQEQKHRRERIVAIIARVSSAPSRGSDSELIDWLESEHARVDPIARLVVKHSRDRNSGEWADVSHDVRGTLQSLAGDTGKPEPRRLRQVRPHTPGPGYICGLCNASHVLGCRDGRVDNGPCPSAPLVTESAGGTNG